MNIKEFKMAVAGRIFSATFVKLNGDIRPIRARLGVKKALKGGELSYDAEAANNLIVWDLDKRGYRTISFDRLLEIKFDGKSYSDEEFEELKNA